MNSTVYADILRASSTMFYRRAAVISSSSFVLFTARQQFSPVFCIAESVVAYFHSYAVSRRLRLKRLVASFARFFVDSARALTA